MRAVVRRQTLGDFPSEPPRPPPEGAVSFTDPIYRLDSELRKRGAKRHVGFTTADFHYDRGGRQQFWLYTPKGGKGGWTPCFSQQPGSSTCDRMKETADEAVDRILAWADEPAGL